MAEVAISNLNQIEEAAADDVLAIDDIGGAETKKIPFESLRGGNALINQDFSIWQENTTFTNPAHGVYAADGYFITKGDGGGTAPSVNVKKNTSVHEDGFEQTMELEITNVGASGASRYWSVAQRMENYKNYIGKTVILAVRYKASAAITLPGAISIHDGVAGSSENISSIGTDWTTKIVTRTINSAATKIEAYFYLIPWTAGEISTTASIYIQWMKLELGSIATPLMSRKTGTELAMCKRYFQKSYALATPAGAATQVGSEIEYVSGVNSADHTIYKTVKLAIPMKAAPTVTLYDRAGNSGKVSMAAGDNLTGNVVNTTENSFNVNGTNGAVATERHLQFHYVAVSRT